MIINKNCHLINGAKNSAIYDLNNNKVYSINHDARIIIEKAIKKQKLEQEESEFICKLKGQNLFDINEILVVLILLFIYTVFYEKIFDIIS